MIFLSAVRIFYEKLCSSSDQHATIDYFNEDKIPSITTSTIGHAMNNFKEGNRPALEKIYSKDITARGETLIRSLKYVFNKIILNRKKPSHVQESVHICPM